MKRMFIMIILVSMFIMLAISGYSYASTGQAKENDVLKLRIANVTQVDHPMNKGCELFAKKIDESTNGRIKITNYPARQLGDDRELFEQVQHGALDIALVSAAPVGSTSILAAALQLPFLFNDWNQWLKVMNDKVTEDLFAGFEKNNVKALAAFDSGFRHVVTVAKPVHSVEDFKGLKFRTAESPLHVDIFKSLGASPTPIPYGEIYTCLQNRVIDGLEMDLPAIIMEKHYEVAKFVTLTKHFTWPGILMVNLKLWNSLSVEDQQLFAKTAKEVMAEMIGYIKSQEAKSMDTLKANGITVIELSKEQRQGMINATQGVVEEYVQKDPTIKAFYEYANSVKE